MTDSSSMSRGFAVRRSAFGFRVAARVLAIAAVVAFAGCASGGGGDAHTVAIGLDLPLSGVDGASAIPVRNAVQLAIDDANARGLPGGYKLVMDDLDDSLQGQHDPAQGAQNMKQFVQDGSVLATLGPMNSSVAKAQIPISNAAGLVQITMAATAIELTHPPAAKLLRVAQPDLVTFFRTCASDDFQGAAAAEFAHARGLRRAFIIDDNESYGKGIADVFAGTWTSQGASVLGHEHLTKFGIDYKSLLTKIADSHPDAIFFGGIVSTGGALLRRQMVDVGLGKVPYFGGDGLQSPEYDGLAGKGADGTFFTLASPDVGHLPEAKAFVAEYLARYHEAPGAYSPTGYAAAQVAVDAIRRCLAAHPGRPPSRAEVLAAVAATSGDVTPVGKITFDPNGDLRHPVISLYEVRGGKEEFVSEGGV